MNGGRGLMNGKEKTSVYARNFGQYTDEPGIRYYTNAVLVLESYSKRLNRIQVQSIATNPIW
jgi:hypothetical protein